MAKQTAPKANETSETPEAPASSGSGVAITLSNGQRRIDYIRDRYYKDGVKRGDIRRELLEKFEHECTYQIVFAATKEKTDPRDKTSVPASGESSDGDAS